jgi:hypothetical protein
MTTFEFHERGPGGGSGYASQAEFAREPGGEGNGESGQTPLRKPSNSHE